MKQLEWILLYVTNLYRALHSLPSLTKMLVSKETHL